MCTVWAVIRLSLAKNEAEQILLLLSLKINVCSRQSQHQNSPHLLTFRRRVRHFAIVSRVRRHISRLRNTILAVLSRPLFSPSSLPLCDLCARMTLLKFRTFPNSSISQNQNQIRVHYNFRIYLRALPTIYPLWQISTAGIIRKVLMKAIKKCTFC